MMQILLVEDNLADIRLTQEAFKEQAMSVVLQYVTDGAEAIKYLLHEQPYQLAALPNLILLDLNLPKKDGTEVLKFIKTHENLKRIPVIILSTSSAESDILKTYNLHANCYLSKPVDYDCFLDVTKAIENFWIQHAKLPVLPS